MIDDGNFATPERSWADFNAAKAKVWKLCLTGDFCQLLGERDLEMATCFSLRQFWGRKVSYPTKSVGCEAQKDQTSKVFVDSGFWMIKHRLKLRGKHKFHGQKLHGLGCCLNAATDARKALCLLPWQFHGEFKYEMPVESQQISTLLRSKS